MPNGEYNGQKLTKLVSTKIPAKTNKIIPNVPSTVLVKYKIAITIAITKRIILSIVPIFFFITLNFIFNKVICHKSKV